MPILQNSLTSNDVGKKKVFDEDRFFVTVSEGGAATERNPKTHFIIRLVSFFSFLRKFFNKLQQTCERTKRQVRKSLPKGGVHKKKNEKLRKRRSGGKNNQNASDPSWGFFSGPRK
jgi:hypothetical protein